MKVWQTSPAWVLALAMCSAAWAQFYDLGAEKVLDATFDPRLDFGVDVPLR